MIENSMNAIQTFSMAKNYMAEILRNVYIKIEKIELKKDAIAR